MGIPIDTNGGLVKVEYKGRGLSQKHCEVMIGSRYIEQAGLFAHGPPCATNVRWYEVAVPASIAAVYLAIARSLIFRVAHRQERLGDVRDAHAVYRSVTPTSSGFHQSGGGFTARPMTHVCSSVLLV